MARAFSTLRISWSRGTPTSSLSRRSASRSSTAIGSDGNREAGGQDVFPRHVVGLAALSANRDAGVVDAHQVTLQHGLGVVVPVADVHPAAGEPLVLGPVAQRPLGPRRRDFEIVAAAGYHVGLVEEGTDDATHPLAVVQRDPARSIDRDPQRAATGAGLLDRVDVVAHVLERRLDQLPDGLYWPGRHVEVPDEVTWLPPRDGATRPAAEPR